MGYPTSIEEVTDERLIDELRRRLERLNTDAEALKKENGFLNGHLAEARQRVRELREEIITLRTDLAEARQRVRELREEIITPRTEVEILKTDVKERDNAGKSLVATIGKLRHEGPDVLTFRLYDHLAMETAVYPGQNTNIAYTTLGLVGEIGELVAEILPLLPLEHISFTGDDSDISKIMYYAIIVGEHAEKLKKEIRSGTKPVVRNHAPTPEQAERINKERGDVLWYLNANARETGTTLERTAQGNIEKLAKRKAEKTLKERSHGDGKGPA